MTDAAVETGEATKTFFVGEKIDRKYLLDLHEVAFCVPNEISEAKMFLGFLCAEEDGSKKFYFTSGTMGNRIVSRSDENSDRMISAMKTSFDSCLSLKEILTKADAIFEKAEGAEWNINLYPAEVTKDILLGLFAN